MLCLNTCITHTHRPPAPTHRLNPVLYYLPSCAPTSQPLIVTTFRQILFLLFTATHERAHGTCVSIAKMSLNIMSSSSIVLLKTDRMSFPLMTAYYTTMNIYTTFLSPLFPSTPSSLSFHHPPSRGRYFYILFTNNSTISILYCSW